MQTCRRYHLFFYHCSTSSTLNPTRKQSQTQLQIILLKASCTQKNDNEDLNVLDTRHLQQMIMKIGRLAPEQKERRGSVKDPPQSCASKISEYYLFFLRTRVLGFGGAGGSISPISTEASMNPSIVFSASGSTTSASTISSDPTGPGSPKTSVSA